MENEGYYFCYSFNQFKHIERNGINYISTGYALSNGNHQFWMYVRTDRLNRVLKEYDPHAWKLKEQSQKKKD